MNSAVVTTSPFAGFEASVRTCVALLRRSWPLLGISLVTWSAIVVSLAFDVSRVYVIGTSVISSAALLLSLRSHLIGPELYLPASARTRSLAIALVGTLASLMAFTCVAVLGGGLILSLDRSLFDPTPVVLAILATGAVSVSPEVLGGDHPRLGWITGVFFWGAMLWQGASEVSSSGDLARLLPLAVAGAILLVSRLPKSWLQYPAPAFLQGGIRDAAFPAGVADPILAVRALLAAERARSVGWRLSPLAAYALVRCVAYPLPPGDHGGWDLVGWFGLPLFATIPFILPISAFGVEATPVALTLPAAPLSVHHAVIREAEIRAGLVFGAFVVVKASWFGVGVLTSVTAPSDHVRTWIEVLGLWSWLAPAFALSVGASAWISYPSQLRVFLFKVAGIATFFPMLGVFIIGGSLGQGFEQVMQRWVQVCVAYTLLGLVALLLGELRARRAFRPYRSVA